MTRDEWKRKWVEALRSGYYPQGRGMMYSNGHYCPLGVACAVYNKHSDIPVPIKVEQWDCIGEIKRFGGETHFAPKSVSEAFGLDLSLSHAIVDMNDSGIRFKDMADFLEDSIYTDA